MELLSPNIDQTTQVICLRKFDELSDLILVRKLIYKTIEVCYPSNYDDTVIRYLLNQNRYENIKSRSNEGTTVVYCVDDKIIGTGNIIADEINSLYVDPVYHNRGIGKKILDQLIDVAQQNDFQKIHLESPPGALKFFLKHGFRVSKEDIKYIDGNYPIHFFKLELSLS